MTVLAVKQLRFECSLEERVIPRIVEINHDI